MVRFATVSKSFRDYYLLKRTALIVTEAFCSCSSIEVIEKQTDWTVDKRSYKILFEFLFLELLDIFT